MARYSASIFLSSFLLFLVQPMLARHILPWYGGSPSVWTACMLFFQALLLGGYLYAHVLGTRLGPRHQVACHLALLALSMVFLPLGPNADWQPKDPGNPVAGILLLLTATVGLPYLLLSASGPLLQRWLYLERSRASPYPLFAVSNLGSLLGLVFYPFVVEPLLSLASQARLWSAAYLMYMAFCGLCGLELLRRERRAASLRLQDVVETPPAVPTPTSERLLWLSLSGCGSVMLLATTNHLCQNVAVVPFLWVLPLGLYLLSFTLCFQKRSRYRRTIWVPLQVASVVVVAILLKERPAMDLRLQILIYSVALLACCMVCHGELSRAKPPASELTSFYLTIALGGALGGVFVGLFAPVAFEGYWEFPLGLLGTYVLAAISILRDKAVDRRPGPWATRLRSHLWAGGAWVLIFLLGSYVYEARASTLAMTRSFYGVLRVFESYAGTRDWRRHLWHGAVSHGGQLLDETRRKTPIQYYGRGTGIAIAIEHHPRRATGLRVGVIGLGTGTLAAYGRQNDFFRFYEIDSAVVETARKYFYYLRDSAAQVEVVLGDARTTLERELKEKGSQQFDLLVLDAFTGDAIPVHLLTREAFALYRSHLRTDGILAVHISSLYFDFKPLVRGLAREMDDVAVLIENPEDRESEIFSCEWALLTTNGEFLSQEGVASAITPWIADGSGVAREVVWTDEYSNLFSLLL